MVLLILGSYFCLFNAVFYSLIILPECEAAAVLPGTQATGSHFKGALARWIGAEDDITRGRNCSVDSAIEYFVILVNDPQG
jgi:hypothetical protein